MEECVDDEIIALKSIYEDELKVSDAGNCKEIRITITPATADDEASKYVCLDVCIKIPESYPSSSPQFIITRSRGLSDEYLKELSDKLQTLMEENVGNCVLFDLLDSVREHLTDNNIPSDICSICLCGFRQSDSFLKTNCFHYFHQYCLKDYKSHVFKNSVDGILSLIEDTDNLSIRKSKIKVPCPVCKTPCDIDVDSINATLAPEDEEVVIDFESLKKQRKEFEKMYRLQLQKGGVIDLEKEKNKFLLSNLQHDYDAYMASAKGEDPNDNETLSAKSVSDSTNTTQTFRNHGSSRGKWMTRRNFTHGQHRNYNNHQHFRMNPQRHHAYERRDDAPCASSQSRKISNQYENRVPDFGSKAPTPPPPTKYFMAKRGGGYNQPSEYSTKASDPPTRYPMQNRRGGYGQSTRRPYRGSWVNNRRKDVHRSKRSHEKSSEKSEL